MNILNKKKNEKVSDDNKINNLYHLQSILSEIDKIKIFRGELPFEIKDLKDETAGIFIRIENLQKLLLDYHKQIGQEKIKITNASTLKEKYKKQIEKVRNNREYDTLSKEIENQVLDIQLSEKYVLDFFKKIALLEKEIQNSQKLFEEKQANLQSKESELENIIFKTQSQEKKLETKVKHIELLIDPPLLVSFNRLRKNMKNGLAVVCIQRNACGGCFNKIPPQRQMEIKMKKKIISCEYCGRIIVDVTQ